MTQTERPSLYTHVSHLWMEPTGEGTSLLMSVDFLPADAKKPIFIPLSNIQETIGYLEVECVGSINGKALLRTKGIHIENTEPYANPSQILQLLRSQQGENSKDKYSL